MLGLLRFCYSTRSVLTTSQAHSVCRRWTAKKLTIVSRFARCSVLDAEPLPLPLQHTECAYYFLEESKGRGASHLRTEFCHHHITAPHPSE